MRVAVFTSGVSAKDPKTTLDPKFDENVIVELVENVPTCIPINITSIRRILRHTQIYTTWSLRYFNAAAARGSSGNILQ